MDILIRIKGYTKAIIQGMTDKGRDWIKKNMDHASDLTVTVECEFIDELKQLMRKDGLSIDD